jgi:hypothetical protein
VITTAEARLIMKDATTMKVALARLQIEVGDRIDDPRRARLRRSNHANAIVPSLSF